MAVVKHTFKRMHGTGRLEDQILIKLYTLTQWHPGQIQYGKNPGKENP